MKHFNIDNKSAYYNELCRLIHVEMKTGVIADEKSVLHHRIIF